jgi:ABC-type sugar transport system ATPase subunit
MIEVRQLERKWGSFVLQVDQLKIEAGQFGVMVGPSGSGKSLFLKLLAGLYAPDRGRIRIAGKDVTEVPTERRRVGLVFQEASLFPHYSVRNNIAYGLKVTGVPRAERDRRVDELIGLLRMENILQRPVPSLSGGEAQKVALARALVVKPDVLLLDEPLSQVDHNTRLELQAELARIHREMELTCLHVTHNREEAFELAGVCAVMHAGRVIQFGDTGQIRREPACAFVAKFLGLDGESRPVGCTELCFRQPGGCDGDLRGEGSSDGQ